MNPVIDAIESRRSTRAFQDKGLPKNIIEEIIDAGRYAPTAMGRQPWKFVIITEHEKIKGLSDAAKRTMGKALRLRWLLFPFRPQLRDTYFVGLLRNAAASKGDSVFYNAPLLVMIIAHRSERYASKDCILAAQNMMLAAHSLGIASCFIGTGKMIPMGSLQMRALNLPRGYGVFAHIVFGYAAPVQTIDMPKRRSIERRKDNAIWI